jgi:hypothetical protein
MGKNARKRRMRDIREHVDGTWGSSDDPLGSFTPMAQNAVLQRLGRLAAGNIDDWESHVDPTLSPGENYQILLENGGKLPREEREEIREAIAATVDEREQSRAADMLREHADVIADGGRQQLAEDIAAEYGREFVEETVTAALRDIEAAQGGDIPDPGAEPEPEPEPKPKTHDPKPVATVGPAAAVDPEPESAATADPDPEPETEPELAAQDWGSLEPQTPEPETPETPEPAAEPEMGAAKLLAAVCWLVIRETGRELAAGGRAVGGVIKLATTDGGTTTQ